MSNNNNTTNTLLIIIIVILLSPILIPIAIVVLPFTLVFLPFIIIYLILVNIIRYNRNRNLAKDECEDLTKNNSMLFLVIEQVSKSSWKRAKAKKIN